MKNFATLLSGSALGVLLAVGAAQAGACSGEIMALQKQMEDTPTMASNPAPSGQTGVAPLPAPGTVPQNAGQTLGAPPSDAAGGGQTANAAPSGTGDAGTPPKLPDANGGTLVQNGTTPQPAPTEPMDSDASTAAQLNTPAGTDTTDTGATGTDAAAQSLARARALDQAGDESGCMNAVGEAKSQLGQ